MGSVKDPSGASQTRTAPSAGKLTRTAALPDVSVTVAPSAEIPVRSPSCPEGAAGGSA